MDCVAGRKYGDRIIVVAIRVTRCVILVSPADSNHEVKVRGVCGWPVEGNIVFIRGVFTGSTNKQHFAGKGGRVLTHLPQMLGLGSDAHAHVDHDPVVDPGGIVEKIRNGIFQVVTPETPARIGHTRDVHRAFPVDTRDADPIVAVRRSDAGYVRTCLLYTSPSPRDRQKSRMPSSA